MPNISTLTPATATFMRPRPPILIPLLPERVLCSFFVLLWPPPPTSQRYIASRCEDGGRGRGMGGAFIEPPRLRCAKMQIAT